MMDLRRWSWPCIASVALLVQGCASVTTGNRQTVVVKPVHEGRSLSDALCSLANDKGQWSLTLPDDVEIQSSSKALRVDCTAETHEAGSASFESTLKAMTFGNAIAGGLVGVVVDTSTGAAFRYPDELTVPMGKPTGKAVPARVVPLLTLSGVRIEPRDVLEYRITDHYNRGASRTARLTVAQVDDAKIAFEEGGRVERRDINAVTRSAALMGDLDGLEPPRGWGRRGMKVGSGWTDEYTVVEMGGPASVTMRAYVEGTEKIIQMGKAIDAYQVEYRGYITRSGVAGATPASVKISAMLDVESRRVLRMSIEIFATSSGPAPGRKSRESIELVAHHKAKA